MRGILSLGTYVPHYRLSGASFAAFHGGKPPSRQRSVASYDEDTTTMAVEAARRAVAGSDAVAEAIWFATSSPTYLEKTNATVVHAALRAPRLSAAMDTGGAVRSGFGSVLAACQSSERVLVAAADIRVGLPTSADETNGGDGAAAFLIGSDTDGPLLAEFLGAVSCTEEFVDRWRVPGDARTKQWDERFGEGRYGGLMWDVLDALQTKLNLSRGEIAHLVVSGQSARAVAAATKRAGGTADPVAASIGDAGAAQAPLALAAALESASAGDVVVVVNLCDGADAVAFKLIGEGRTQSPTVSEQIAGDPPTVTYSRFLSWRGILSPEPPRRPEPARVSSPAAQRRDDWKFGFVGTREGDGGALHLPPQRVSFDGAEVDAMEPAPMADATATIVTFTVDRLVYSQSPPVVFAVVDFDGGGRLPIELTDCSPTDVTIGAKVAMTFRRLSTADGIANYFWKGRLIAPAATTSEKDS